MGGAGRGIEQSHGEARERATSDASVALPRYLPSLTGLRFWAAALVVLYHMTSYIGPLPVLTDLTRFGRTGVAFFFVLSGFVLAWTYAGTSTPVRIFWWRRFARIWPLHIVATILSASVFIWVGSRYADALSFRDLWPAVLLIHAWFADPDIIRGGNGATWSLSDEAFFYACFPFVLPILARVRRVSWLLAIPVVATVISLILWLVIPAGGIGAYSRGLLLDYLPATRFPQFVSGVALALAVRRGWRCPISVPGAALIMVLYHVALIPWARVTELGDPFGPRSASQLFSLIPFALLIAAVASSDLRGQRLHLSRPAFVLLGQASFAWYLIHASGMLVYAHLFGEPQALGPTIVAWVVVVVVTQAAAIGVYLFMEKPVERWLRGLVSARRIDPRTAPARA